MCINTFLQDQINLYLSYYDITLLCSRIHLKWISLCYCAKTWCKNSLESISLWRQLLPYISWSGSPIRISHAFVLFKSVTLTWINYLETWLHSDNTSCYYILYWTQVCQLLHYSSKNPIARTWKVVENTVGLMKIYLKIPEEIPSFRVQVVLFHNIWLWGEKIRIDFWLEIFCGKCGWKKLYYKTFYCRN